MELVSVSSKRFLEGTETGQSSMKLRLADEIGDKRGSEHEERSMFRTQRGVTVVVMRLLVWRKAHRKGHWSGEKASCCGSTLQSKSSERLGAHDEMEPESAKSDHHNPVLLGVNVNKQAELGLLSDFWTGATLDPAEADQMLVICMSPDEKWYSGHALVLALSQNVETYDTCYPKKKGTSICNVVRACVPTYLEKTMDDGSPCDDSTCSERFSVRP